MLLVPFAVTRFACHVFFYCHALCLSCSLYCPALCFCCLFLFWHTFGLSCFLLLSHFLLILFPFTITRCVFLLLVHFTFTLFAYHVSFFCHAFCLSCFLILTRFLLITSPFTVIFFASQVSTVVQTVCLFFCGFLYVFHVFKV